MRKKNLLLTFTFVVTLLLSLTTTSSAFTLTPTNIVLEKDASETVSIVVTNPPKKSDGTTVNAVSITLDSKNVRITEFREADGIISLPICENGAKYSDTQICADLASTTPFTSGQVLATFKVIKTSDEDGEVTVNSESKYSDGTAVDTKTIVKIFGPASRVETTPGANGQSGLLGMITSNTNIFIGLLCCLGLVILVLFFLLLKSKSDKKEESKNNIVLGATAPLKSEPTPVQSSPVVGQNPTGTELPPLGNPPIGKQV